MYDLEFDRSSFFRSKYSKRRKQAMAQGDDIDRMDLFEYYGWTCHLCDGEIDRELRHPHPMSATIDHVVPLERGGRHVWDNVKPAHKQCNEAKGSDTVL
jgi:5-methylcytosine-specific restriction endonuclease McrA